MMGGRNDQETRRRRYNEAFGDYQGGYQPFGGFGGFGGFERFEPEFNNPPPLMGRGYGPGGPPNKNRMQCPDFPPISFLISCGVPENIVYNLPLDALNMMEPNYCHICRHDIESFLGARMHYNSRGHKIKQNHYTGQQGSNNKPQHREKPLKSRDLYCELCDVEITSRAHADSHYSGRSHRAIVDERKPPKNTTLCRPKAEGRLRQLIRRERKFMAAEVEPINETVEASDSTNAEPRPELYCEICKTSVTCSEQMLMHKNGKKHLAKEKQHIFRMMKYGSQDNTNGSENFQELTEGEEMKETQDDEVDGNKGHGSDVEGHQDEGEQWAQGGGASWNADEQ